jgi:hypothetical protein
MVSIMWRRWTLVLMLLFVFGSLYYFFSPTGPQLNSFRLSKPVKEKILDGSFLFVREYFVGSDERTREIERAIGETMDANPDSMFAFVVELQADIEALGRYLSKRKGENWIIFKSYGMVLMATLFEIARRAKIHFVVSTADVAVANLSNFRRNCEKGLKEKRLFVVARTEDSIPCQNMFHKDSFDVYIGDGSLITHEALGNLEFAPRYWGVENVVGFVLTWKKFPVVNLCGVVLVSHMHSKRNRRADKMRIRINNNSPEGSVTWRDKSHKLYSSKEDLDVCKSGAW